MLLLSAKVWSWFLFCIKEDAARLALLQLSESTVMWCCSLVMWYLFGWHKCCNVSATLQSIAQELKTCPVLPFSHIKARKPVEMLLRYKDRHTNQSKLRLFLKLQRASLMEKAVILITYWVAVPGTFSTLPSLQHFYCNDKLSAHVNMFFYHHELVFSVGMCCRETWN